MYAIDMLDQDLQDTQIQELLEANYDLLDQVGILQHHDAVTGTCNNATCNDYRYRIFKGISENNAVYTERIAKKVAQATR